MRKILLASSALVGAALMASSAFAADLTVKINGYDEVMGGYFDESQKYDPVDGTTPGRNSVAFENEFKINFDVLGHASNGMTYGALVSLWNGPDYTDEFKGDGNGAHTADAYVWMAANWGKLMLGDAHGASDLLVYAPTVGTNQIDGNYTEFTSTNKLWGVGPSYIDNTEDSTRITYYTPVVSGFQAGFSYAPNMYSQGNTVDRYASPGGGEQSNTTLSVYENYLQGALQWTGGWDKVNLKASALVSHADANEDVNELPESFDGGSTYTAGANLKSEFTSWGIGGQVNFYGLTLGASYTDPGDYFETVGQDRDQYAYSVGAKYELDKAAFAVNYMGAEGYDNSIAYQGFTPATSDDAFKTGYGAVDANYIKDYQALGLGATYTWFPGLVTGLDVVFFDQRGANAALDDSGEVVILSQRVNF